MILWHFFLIVPFLDSENEWVDPIVSLLLSLPTFSESTK